jgi:hypothetical protein
VPGGLGAAPCKMLVLVDLARRWWFSTTRNGARNRSIDGTGEIPRFAREYKPRMDDSLSSMFAGGTMRHLQYIGIAMYPMRQRNHSERFVFFVGARYIVPGESASQRSSIRARGRGPGVIEHVESSRNAAPGTIYRAPTRPSKWGRNYSLSGGSGTPIFERR